MITAITVVNYQGDILKMDLSYPERTGLMVYEVTGIGAGQADINNTELARSDGATFNSSRIASRNIVLSLKLMAMPTVEYTRHLSYKYFRVKKPLSLIFHTDSGDRKIDGYVESNDPVIFSSQEYTQISILCLDPYFYDARTKRAILSGFDAEFEFPFENDSLDEPKLVFGNGTMGKRVVFDYEGDIETGVDIVIEAKESTSGLWIVNESTLEMMTITNSKMPSSTGKQIVNGDVITITTKQRKKQAVLNRAGVKHNIIGALGRNPVWFTLEHGLNKYGFGATTGGDSVLISMYYNEVYEGV